MPISRVLLPAVLVVGLLWAAIAYPSEMFTLIGSSVLTLTTASSIVFFAFVILATLFGFERTSGRHLAPAAPVHTHRSLRDEV
ncbi:hypothetical protein V5F49_15680 [Xanthobacter sp. V3C-3]|uniref:hypothetical protein n=1 Tax=Xanthobacter lutulentifluminis TaxID=3119935 RepID=UPI00372AA9E7